MTYLILAILAFAITPLFLFMMLAFSPKVKVVGWSGIIPTYFAIYAILYLPIFYRSY